MFSFSSCDNEDLELNDDNNQIELNSSEIALRKFEKSIIEAQEKIISNTDKQNKTHNKSYNSNTSEQLLEEVSIASIAFMEDYGFTIEDYYEMFGTYNISQIQKEIAGSGVLLYALETNKILDSNLTGISSKNSFSKSRGGDFKSCFLDATGISAGIALVGAVTGQAGGKAIKKAFMKAIKKIGGRLAGGIGLVLMAADFTYCMLTNVAVIESTSSTCEDLLEAKLLNSHNIILISKNDIDLDTSNNYVNNIEQTKSYQTYNVSYGYTPIAIQDVTENTPCIVKKNIGANSFVLGKDIDLSSIKEYERLVFDDFFDAIPNDANPIQL